MEFIYANETHTSWLNEQDEHVDSTIIKQKIHDQQIVIAQLHGQPVAWLRFGFFWDTIPFMNLLFVVGGVRGKGVGSKLVAFWESAMQEQGYAMVLTSSQADESAQHFYRKVGYKDCGSLLLENEPLEIFFSKLLSK